VCVPEFPEGRGVLGERRRGVLREDVMHFFEGIFKVDSCLRQLVNFRCMLEPER
jgi:hypothetical protein